MTAEFSASAHQPTSYPRRRKVNRRGNPSPEALAQWYERFAASFQVRRLLHWHRCLIRMQVLLRTKVAPTACAVICDAFRQAGFVVEDDAQGRLTVTGEACLAVTFMVRAAEVGILSDAFEVRLGEILSRGTRVRVERHEDVLQALDPMLSSIASIDLPKRRAAR